MTIKNIQERAETLVHAMPYIKKYHDKTVVVKYGGNAMIDENLRKQVMQDIALLWLTGVRIVLVHGGGPDMTNMMKKIGKESEFVDGLRVTDEETVDIAKMVLAGKVNKELVNLINSNGGNAVGLSGVDGLMIEAKKKDDKLGFVGDIVKINPEVIMNTLTGKYIPVISTIGADSEGNTYNINADTAASRIAGAMKAESLIIMTNAPGLLKDTSDESSLISELTIKEAESMCKDGSIVGGMLPKIECCISALKEGVGSVTILDGRISHSLLMELLTDQGAGTIVRK